MKKTFHASSNWALSLACSLGIARPDITGQWAKAVGPARWRYAWAFRSLRDAGAVLAFSSDWNVAEMEPLIGIYTALTARDSTANQRVVGYRRRQSIWKRRFARTRSTAHSQTSSSKIGIYHPGKYADLVMLSDDLFKIPAEKMKDTNIVWTMVGGKTVWSKQ